MISQTFCESLVKLCVTKHKCHSFLCFFSNIGQCLHPTTKNSVGNQKSGFQDIMNPRGFLGICNQCSKILDYFLSFFQLCGFFLIFPRSIIQSFMTDFVEKSQGWVLVPLSKIYVEFNYFYTYLISFEILTLSRYSRALKFSLYRTR